LVHRARSGQSAQTTPNAVVRHRRRRARRGHYAQPDRSRSRPSGRSWKHPWRTSGGVTGRWDLRHHDMARSAAPR